MVHLTGLEFSIALFLAMAVGQMYAVWLILWFANRSGTKPSQVDRSEAQEGHGLPSTQCCHWQH